MSELILKTVIDTHFQVYDLKGSLISSMKLFFSLMKNIKQNKQRGKVKIKVSLIL
jgi:hypothetical protein